MSATDHLARLAEEVREITQPLVDHMNEVDEEIKTKQEELQALRDARSQLRAIVKGIDPALVPPLYKKNGKPKTKPTKKAGSEVAADTLAALTEWVQERREELNGNGGFRAVDIHPREDFTLDGLAHVSRVNKTLALLHDQGVLRLDRWIRGKDLPHRPTGKFYKVI